MKTKKIFALLIAAALIVMSFCGCETDSRLSKDKDAPQGYEEAMRAFVNESAVGNKITGFGVEIYPEMFLSEGFGDAEKQAIADSIRDLGITFVRISADPLWYEPVNDNTDAETTKISGFDFENENMKAFKEALSLAGELSLPVTLVIRGAKAGSWLGCTYEDYEITAPNDIYEYAENVMALLTWIDGENESGNINANISELIIQNKANATWVNDSGTNLPSYYKAAEQVALLLRRSELQAKPVLVISDDCTNNNTWFKRCTQKLSSIAGKYSFHASFLERNAELSEIYEAASARYEYLKENDPSSELAVSSFGTDGVLSYGVTDFNDSITSAAQSVMLICGGASSLCCRNIADFTYNGVTYSDGLLKSAAEGFARKPLYDVISMLTKYLTIGAVIYKADLYDYNDDEILAEYTDGEISFAAVKTEDGKWTYIAVNKGMLYAKKIAVYTLDASGTYKTVSFGENGISENSGAVSVKNGKIYFSIQTESFTAAVNG